ncbi:hypothetical protein L3V35_09175 [Vibrio sp. L5-1]|uniref:hypothetical protein n=1 Tax=Vibrio sp. L5-1 TaxID=2912254 RepID=UPI001F4487A0|nr:hypothetical protein [Vibrio sp. L5-1]MCF7495220.1 hypothetical protein [Vibrio sp. L5-1]
MKNSNKLYKALFLISLIATFIIAVVLYFYIDTFSAIIKTEPGVYGTVGDFLGGTLNPALSFLGLIALLLTLGLQHQQLEISHKELQLSRKELQETRSELSRSAKAQEEATQHQQKQVRVQELATRLSAIEMLLSIDGKDLTVHFANGYSSSRVDVKSYSGVQKAVLYQELGDIYKELSKMDRPKAEQSV